MSTAIQTPVSSIEEWSAHPDWPCYDVSTHGRVRSWHNGRFGWRSEPKLLKNSPSNSGYAQVCLSYRGRHANKGVHVLMLETFVKARPEGHEARHLNGNKLDNRLENLAWGTPVENAADKVLHGTHNIGERNGLAKLTEQIVREARALRAEGWQVTALARHYGVAQGTMSTALRGLTWSHL